MTTTIKDLGERELLNRLKRFMRCGQIEDDIAEINMINKNLLINTDLLVEKIHFSEKISNAKDIGWKCITTNISDLICSGSKNIISFNVGLVLPPSTHWKWVENLYEGMGEAMQEFGGEIIGGDCSCGEIKMISITAIGEMNPPRLHRGNALPGDYIVSTGFHGLSRLGLALLSSEKLPSEVQISPELINRAINSHKRPYPAVKSLQALIECKPESSSWRAAGTDSSDGLIESIRGICQSSNCQAVLTKNSILKDPDWPEGSIWDEWVLYGGEDYELILSLPKKWAEALSNKLESAQIIGFIKEGKPNVFWDNLEEINVENSNIFQHF
ncbi:thiamine-phosphate kinase [Prochlorococcus marinus]|uniref:thiamine-phosphate kinase n=1 Tax=Prochlorococcus marinus TaxID=1219 RepID=UPI0022B2D0C1|nr:thiamine-phosphate kinase [Prochlorococcus marinus]